MTDSKDGQDGGHAVHRPFDWSSDDFKGLAIAGGSIVVWALAILLFGFAGLIVPALLLVIVTFVLLIIISRG